MSERRRLRRLCEEKTVERAMTLATLADSLAIMLFLVLGSFPLLVTLTATLALIVIFASLCP